MYPHDTKSIYQTRDACYGGNQRNELHRKESRDYKIIKKIGHGFYGSAFMAKWEGKVIVIKKQKIFEADLKQDYNKELWRELEFYTALKKFKPHEQVYFTGLYKYKIVECDHIQPRDASTSKLPPIIRALDASPYCCDFYMEFIDGITFKKWLIQHQRAKTGIYLSLMLQILQAIEILGSYGYCHNDIHPENIMIIKTKKSAFTFRGKEFSTYGNQVKLIDYGLILHSKYLTKKLDSWDKAFAAMGVQEYIAAHEINIFRVFIYNYDYAAHINILNNKTLPWQKAKYRDWISLVNKFVADYPELFVSQFSLIDARYLFLREIDTYQSLIHSKKPLEWYLLRPQKKKVLTYALFEFYTCLAVEAAALQIPDSKISKYFGWDIVCGFFLPRDIILNLTYAMSSPDLLFQTISLLLEKNS